MYYDLNKIYDFLVEYDFCTEEEIKLLTTVNGWSLETFEQLIYYASGCHDIEQLLQEAFPGETETLVYYYDLFGIEYDPADLGLEEEEEEEEEEE